MCQPVLWRPLYFAYLALKWKVFCLTQPVKHFSSFSGFSFHSLKRHGSGENAVPFHNHSAVFLATHEIMIPVPVKGHPSWKEVGSMALACVCSSHPDPCSMDLPVCSRSRRRELELECKFESLPRI